MAVSCTTVERLRKMWEEEEEERLRQIPLHAESKSKKITSIPVFIIIFINDQLQLYLNP